MDRSAEIKIPLSKSKMVLMLIGCAVFVASGIWFVTNPPKISHPILGNPLAVILVGIVAIAFFGMIGFSLFKKLTDNSPGLVISDEGVMDNASGFSKGFVPWEDVVEVRETKVLSQTFVNLVVKNPQEYIDKQKSAFKRKAMQMNYNSYGTVISISANGLECDYTELKEMLYKKFGEVKGRG